MVQAQASSYNALLTYMRDIVPSEMSIYVLKSSDQTSEIALYKKFYEYYGHSVTIYEANEMEEHIGEWSHDAIVFSALNQQRPRDQQGGRPQDVCHTQRQRGTEEKQFCAMIDGKRHITDYINPSGAGMQLYDKDFWKSAGGIHLSFLRRDEDIRYKQRTDEFVADLSIIDLMMYSRVTSCTICSTDISCYDMINKSIRKAALRMMQYLPTKLYLRLRYRYVFYRSLHLDNPRAYSEKLQ